MELKSTDFYKSLKRHYETRTGLKFYSEKVPLASPILQFKPGYKQWEPQFKHIILIDISNTQKETYFRHICNLSYFFLNTKNFSHYCCWDKVIFFSQKHLNLARSISDLSVTKKKYMAYWPCPPEYATSEIIGTQHQESYDLVLL